MKDEGINDPGYSFVADGSSNAGGGASRPSNGAASAMQTRPSSFRLHTSSFLKWLVLISRFGLAAMFLFAAGAKVWILKAFAKNVSELLVSAWINPDRWRWPVTFAVISAEVVASVLLLVPRTVRLGAIWLALLLIGFSGFALYYVYVLHGEPLECGCFGGIIASQLGVKTALRNLVLLVPALIVAFGASSYRSASGSERVTDREPQKGARGTSQISYLS